MVRYEKQIVSQIMYVHWITDSWMSTTVPCQNLPGMFAELTGPRSAKDIILTTTMWDKLNPKFDDGGKWKKILKKEYWNAMIHYGTAIEHFLNSSDSAWSIISNVVNPHAVTRRHYFCS